MLLFGLDNLILVSDQLYLPIVFGFYLLLHPFVLLGTWLMLLLNCRFVLTENALNIREHLINLPCKLFRIISHFRVILLLV